MTAPTEPLKLWVCLCCGETWKDTADLTPTWDGYGHVVSPEGLCGEVVEYAPVVARDPAAELRAAISDAAAFLKRIDDWEGSVILSDEVWATSDGMPKLTRELYDQWIELQDERNRLRAALAATEGSE